MKITAQTESGQMLLALRAGSLSPMQLKERFHGYSTTSYKLIRAGLVVNSGTGDGAVYRITAAGREACPSRRTEKDKKCD